MENPLLDKNFEKIIEDVIDSIFPNLEIGDLKEVKFYTVLLIQIMAFKFNFNEETIGSYQTVLTQNNNQHIYSIINLLLPYIDDKNNFELHKQIYNLSDITMKKKPGISDPTINPYLISTYQYSRARTIYDGHDGVNIEEYAYNVHDLITSFYVILNTIEQVRTKLYVNWLDIIPITKNNYKDSDLYQQSFEYTSDEKQFSFIKGDTVHGFTFWDLDYKDIMAKYSGITADDVFNAIHVFLFKEIFNSGAKWLMYEKQLSKHTKPKTYLEILNDIINISYLDMSLDSLKQTTSDRARTEWSLLQTMQDDIYMNFIKCVMFKFDLNYCNDEIKTEYDYDYKTFYENYARKKKENNEDTYDIEDEDDFLDLDKIKLDSNEYKEKVADFFNKIPFDIIYDFFDEQVKKFKRTWYGKNMIKVNHGIVQIDSTIDINKSMELKHVTKDNTYYLTYKNMYNYSKYLSIQIVGMENITDARGLTYSMKREFVRVLNLPSTSFNMNKVIKKTYGNTTANADIKSYQKFIEQNYKSSLKDNVFLIFISLGILNDFKPRPDLTNIKMLGSSDDERKATLRSRMRRIYIDDQVARDNYLDTEYYLTRDTFRSLELYKGTKQINWLEHVVDGSQWFNYFAMSWISQINFYNHFLNNRVMLVTGSTGQGKSVVVPILFYYASLALNMNSNAKVLSTQALVAATQLNSTFMASNLGVPIVINGFKTFNPYIQYSTQGDKHIIAGQKTFIKEVTDRTLLEELLKNPLLKMPKGKSKHNKKQEYTDENLYDVIIIDEAHMHNTSMDMILSIIKSSIMVNNQLKLVITSATMEDDEFIYRRYYKHINENYAYPLNSKTYYDETNYPIDKVVVDRRFHISPPGQTDRFKVENIYLDKELNSYEEAELKGIETTINILNTSVIGDILFFTTTEKNILYIVETLNNNSPGDVIALPLFSKLRERIKDINWFELIQNIDKTLSSIQFEKSDIVDVITMGSEGFQKGLVGRYKRVIVVATNVVEASITIKTLKYVIDTGYAINISYNSEENKNEMTNDKISESSRMQRRGRVGRAQAGYVYYMYTEGSHKHIKPGYELVTKDIAFDLFKLLSNDGAQLLLDFEYHPQNFNFIGNDITEYNKFLLREENKTIKNLYLKQYKFGFASGIEIHPFLNPLLSPSVINIKKFFPTIYDDGFGFKDIMDMDGTFYIIHPGEIELRRNVLTGAIIDQSVSFAQKIIASFRKMQYLKYVYYDDVININKMSETTDKYVHKYHYIKLLNKLVLDEGEYFQEITSNFTEEEIIKIFKTIFVANMFGVTNDVMKILALIYSMGTYRTFVRKQVGNPKFNDYNNFVKMWSNNTSELFSYRDIMNGLITRKKLEKVVVSTHISDNRYRIFESLVKEKGMKIFSDASILRESKLSKKEIEMFIESKNKRYSSKERNSKFNIISNELLSKQLSIDEQCAAFYVDTKIMEKALRLYDKFVNFVGKDDVIKSMAIFKDVYLTNSSNNDENILRSFLENYGLNISFYKDDKFFNILTNMHIKKPKISLTQFYESFYFYVLHDNDTIGLTSISKKLIKSVFSLNSFDTNIRRYDTSIIDYPDIELITGKNKIIKSANEEYDMNSMIKTDISFLSKKK